MKVSNKVSSPLAETSAQAAEKTGKSGRPKGRAAGAVDLEKGGFAGSAKVDVSAKAMEMKRAKELATPSSDIDESKVARLQKMIDAGEYKVDAEAIADRLLDEHLKMPT